MDAGLPSRQSSPRRRRWALWVLLVGALVLPVWVRALLESRAELEAGQQALASNDYEGAVRAYRHAAEWAAPFNPFSAQAVEGLLRLGRGQRDDAAGRERELLALESLRSAILVTRSVYTPHAERLPEVEARIAELRGAEAAARTGGDPAVETRRQLELLESSRARAPRSGWSLLTTAAFAGWLVVTYRALRGSFDEQGRLRRRYVAIWGGLSMLTLATWIVGLTLV